MATLVLTAVGTIFGGPIGGAIGAVIGGQIDGAIFTPKGARGPRLQTLAVQGSSYGAELPRLFGTMRVSGSVIWSTDLRETKHKSGGGKGKPKTTTYSYSASFVVALSARDIRSVRRIWADGRLLRGAGGDWKSDIGAFRVHAGDEDQPTDPLIAAAQRIEATPAHRGLAYAVFENLQLADFGNRIPSLSFEVVADPAPVSVGTIATILSDGDIAGDGGPAIGGYAAGGDSLRGAIEALAGALPVSFADTADGLRLIDEDADPIAIDANELGSSGTDKRAPRLSIDRQAAGTLNEALTIAYYDPALDYQRGSQSARRDVSARRAGTVELAAAIGAAQARAIVETRLAREWAGRTTASLTLPSRCLDITAGAIVALPGQAGRWRVTERTLDTGGIALTAMRLSGLLPPALPAGAGTGVSQPDLPHGPTTLALLDLPSFGDDAVDTPTLLIAAAGVSAGWRKAALMASLDDGASWEAIDQTAPPAVIGRAVTQLGPGANMIRDTVNTVDIELLADDMALVGSDGTALSATTNLALLGDELIQFATAVQIGPQLFRLGGLLRGRRGSEWAIDRHAIGDIFVLIDPATLSPYTLPPAAIGAKVRISAMGIGDDAPVEQAILFQGRALRPPAPVAFTAARAGDGSFRLGWCRRSRLGWAWMDGVDAPLGEESERYRLTARRAGGTPLMIETNVPSASLAPGAIGGIGPLMLTVDQLGTLAPSLPGTSLILSNGA